ncbi:MAG TPA: tetratricopeptide repeat protein [Vicinamibacterales bacterium]|nr:tetratricopeptide repeat protein [Vicinamibacterales bacterium]
MSRSLIRLSFCLVAVLLLASVASAQDWRGMGRVGGKVVDDATGEPIAGVTVKATLARAGNRGPESKSNAKGDWAIGGVAGGEWGLDFIKEGYETKSISVGISESGRIPPMEIRMTKKAPPKPDANEELKAKLTDAAAKMNAKQFAEARKIYEELVAQYPDVKQFRPLIARTYYEEGNKAAAIEQLRKALEQDPESVEVKMLLGNTLMEAGKEDEARQVLATIDESKITDPAMLINPGIELINDKKHAEAVAWFDKAISRFPQHPDAYYYRGIAYISLGKAQEAKADLEKFVSIAPPDAPELATAKQILASIK